MNFTFRKFDSIGILTLSGELTEQHAVDLRSALLMSLDNSETLLTRFDEVTAMDSCCYEILFSAYLIALRLHKHFRPSGIRPEVLDKYPCFFPGVKNDAIH